jgi:hypothetical protein
MVKRNEPEARIVFEGRRGEERAVKKDYGDMYQDLDQHGRPITNNYVNEQGEVWAIARWHYSQFDNKMGPQQLTGNRPRGMGGSAGGSADPLPAAPAKWYSDLIVIEQNANELRNIMEEIQANVKANVPGFVPVQDPKADSLKLYHSGILGGKFNMTAFIKYKTPDYTKVTFSTKYVGEDKDHISAVFEEAQWLTITSPGMPLSRFFEIIALKLAIPMAMPMEVSE